MTTLSKPLSVAMLLLCALCTLESRGQFIIADGDPQLLVDGTRGRHYLLSFFNQLDELDATVGTVYIASGSPEMIDFSFVSDSPLYARLIPTDDTTSLDDPNAAPIARYEPAPVTPAPYLELAPFNGEAVVAFTVLADGTVDNISAVSYTHLEFYEAAAEAIQNWLFEPGKTDGVAVSTPLQKTFTFQIDLPSGPPEPPPGDPPGPPPSEGPPSGPPTTVPPFPTGTP